MPRCEATTQFDTNSDEVRCRIMMRDDEGPHRMHKGKDAQGFDVEWSDDPNLHQTQ